MKDELKYSLGELKKACQRLQEGCAAAKDGLDRDGVIQRFEFTFELLWKTLRLFLRDKGLDAKSPKDSLKEAFRMGWIKDEETFSQMLEDRNLTSHFYKEEKAKEIFIRIKDKYVAALHNVVVALGEILDK